mgnify:CR=1 FL=1
MMDKKSNQKNFKCYANEGYAKNEIIIGAVIGIFLFGSGFAVAQVSFNTSHTCSPSYQDKKAADADKALDEFIHVIEYKGGGTRF